MDAKQNSNELNAYETAAATDEITDDELLDLETLARIEARSYRRQARQIRMSDPRNTKDRVDAETAADYFDRLAEKLAAKETGEF